MALCGLNYIPSKLYIRTMKMFSETLARRCQHFPFCYYQLIMRECPRTFALITPCNLLPDYQKLRAISYIILQNDTYDIRFLVFYHQVRAVHRSLGLMMSKEPIFSSAAIPKMGPCDNLRSRANGENRACRLLFLTCSSERSTPQYDEVM